MALIDEMTNQNLSLLWPAGTLARTDRQLSSEAIRDLALETLVGRKCPFNLHQDAMWTVLYQLCTDAAVLCYQQATLQDLSHLPVLVEAFQAVLPQLDELMLFSHPHFGGDEQDGVDRPQAPVQA